MICLLSLLQFVAKWYSFTFLDQFPVRSGNIRTDWGIIEAPASDGGIVASRAANAGYRYNLSIYSNVISPSNGPSYRLHAFPLRCLSTVLGM